MSQTLYPAPPVPSPKLGRVPAPDLRDSRFPLRAAMPKRLQPSRTFRTWHSRLLLDQRDTSACVGFSGTYWLDAGPVRNLLKPGEHFDSAFRLYRRCQDHDEWPSAEPDYYGTSVRALFKVLQADGLVGEYRWANSAEELAWWILEKGPAVVGTLWTESMFTPNARGFVKPEGEVVGGHAYAAIGANWKAKRLDFLQSWGPWGKRDSGRFSMTFADFDVLMGADGEACTAVEVKAV